MSSQLDVKSEERELRQKSHLYRALDFGIIGALEAQGITLLGMSLKFDAYNALLTIRADVGGERKIAFVGSDCLINAFLKAESAALHDRLSWKVDKYQK